MSEAKGMVKTMKEGRYGQYGGQSNGQSGDSFGSWPFGFGFGG